MQGAGHRRSRKWTQAEVLAANLQARTAWNTLRHVFLGVLLSAAACYRVDKLEIRQTASQVVPGSQRTVWTNVVDELHDLGVDVDPPADAGSSVQFTFNKIQMDVRVEPGATSRDGARSSVIQLASDGGRKEMEALLETLVQYHRKTWNGSDQEK